MRLRLIVANGNKFCADIILAEVLGEGVLQINHNVLTAAANRPSRFPLRFKDYQRSSVPGSLVLRPRLRLPDMVPE